MNRPIRFAARLAAAAPLLALAACGGGEGTESGNSAPPAFAACASCHAVEPGKSRGAGPNLYGVVGRPAGTAEGFNYSKAMQESGMVWTVEALDRFLAAPSEVVPGTRMNTALKDPARRKAVIEYLATLSPSATAAEPASATGESR